MSAALVAGIEGGGTKFVCAVGTAGGEIERLVRIPTTTPDETAERVVAFLRTAPAPLAALGIGSFGPLDLRRDSPHYGRITSTPKPGWRDADVAARIAAALDVPLAVDTDVNAAAYGEWRRGALAGCDVGVYLTIGTGIGGGAIVGGRPIHGSSHPEIGHVRVVRDADDRGFAGSCPYHGDCLEGLASGTALHARYGVPAEQLPPGHAAFATAATYVARALIDLVYTLAPQRIVIGGGLAARPSFLAQIRAALEPLGGGYAHTAFSAGELDDVIVAPALGARAGVIGAMMLGAAAAPAAAPAIRSHERRG